MAKPTIEKLNEAVIVERKIRDWPIWEKEVSKFPWTYDGMEECLIIEGEVIISTEEGDVHIKAGDFVTFPAGLSCSWDILSPVRKYYNFP